MKNFLIILILSVAVVLGAVFIYNKFKKSNPSVKQNNQSAQTVKNAALEAKKTEFNNTIKEITKDDSDADGLSNSDEAKYGTDPNSADTDHDGLLDGDEVNIYHTDPLKADTDGDGFSDGNEVWHHTNPLDPNSHP